MKKFLAVVLAVSVNFPAFLLADDAVPFISFTRRQTPLSKLPTNVAVINLDQIQRSGAKTVADVLDLALSVDVSRSGALGSSAFVRLRGVPSSNQVQILVDDQPLGGVSIQNVDVGLIPISDIERIEIVRGGSSVLYGANAIGGVINLITKKNSREETSISVQTEDRSFKTKADSVEALAKAGIFNTNLQAASFVTDGYQRNSHVENQHVTGTIGTALPNGGRWSAQVSHTDHEAGSPNGTPVAFEDWNGDLEREPNSSDQQISNQRTESRLNVAVPIGSLLSIQSLTYHSSERYKLRSEPGSDLLFGAYDNFISGNDTRVSFVNGLIVGAAYERDQRASLAQADRHITNTAGYLQQELNLGRFGLIPAVRYDHHSTFGHQWNPRLSTLFQVTDDLKFSANAGRSYRAPTLVDLYIISQDPFFPAFDFFGNPNLKPETAWTYDAGVENRFSDWGVVSLTGFYNRIKDRIVAVDTDLSGINDTTANVGVAELSGTEVSARILTGLVEQEVSYTFQRAKGSSATSSQYLPLRLTPRHLLNYQVTIRLCHGFRLTNMAQYVARQYQFDGDLGVRLPSYTLWHATLDKRFNESVNAFVAVRNITDKLYAESITFGNPVPQPTRTFGAGVKVKFGRETP